MISSLLEQVKFEKISQCRRIAIQASRYTQTLISKPGIHSLIKLCPVVPLLILLIPLPIVLWSYIFIDVIVITER